MKTFEIAGVRELARKLDALAAPERRKALSRGVRAGSKSVLEAARRGIPSSDIDKWHKIYTGRDVHGGFALRSIASAVKVSRDRRSASALMGVRREAFYATQFVEVGTSKQAKRPWLVPAFEETANQQLAALADVMRRDVLGVARAK